MPKQSPLSAAKMSVIAPGHSRPGSHIERGSQNKREVPSTGPAYLMATVQLLLIESDTAGLRALEMCDEAATMLMEEAEAALAHKAESENLSAPTSAAQPDRAHDEFSPREADADTDPADDPRARTQDAPTVKRLEATYLLMAGAVAGMSAHDVEGASAHSLRLARRALALLPSPMTEVTLAMSCFGMRHVAPLFQPSDSDNPSDDLPAIMVTLVQRAITTLAKPSTLLPEEQCYLVRALWLLAILGHVDEVVPHLNRIIATNPGNYLALLLMAMIHTMNGDNRAALVATLHMESQYVEDPTTAAVTALLRQAERQPHASDVMDGPTPEGTSGSSDEELGVALARTSQFANSAHAMDTMLNRKKALKALCLHCAPGEENASTLHLSAMELKRRAAGHWLLLAHVATRAGAFSLAELALESLLAYLTNHHPLHSEAYATALTSYALLILARRLDEAGETLSSAVARLVHTVVRPLKAQAPRQAPPQRSTFGLPSSATGTGRGSYLPTADNAGTAERGSPSKDDGEWHSNAIFAQNCLDKAVEVAPYYSDVHVGLGTLKLLTASQPELSAEERYTKLTEAADSFMRAVQCAPTRSAAYMGMGCALEAQGVGEESLDFYAAAAELSAREAIIPLDYFVYLFE